jgi:glycogen(starch) synthase
MQTKADYLFEVSWEVCNKVGGIYTVIISKLIPILKTYKDSYYAIGPYFPVAKSGEFKEKPAPDFLKSIFSEMQKIGIKCYFGTWMVDGEPNAILIDYSKFTYKTNDIKGKLWESFKIDSLNSEFHDFDEPIVWSYAAGILLEKIKSSLGNKNIVAHCHEWLAGGTLLYLKMMKVKVGTVFTTHATMLGRTLAAHNIDLYNLLDKIKPEEYAYKYKIQAKYLTERACAQNSDVFTTVSEITGLEATYFLGKKPDILLPNGLDVERFPTFDEASVKHKQLKAKVKKFLMYFFFPYYQFDLDDTLLFFLAGRNEFHDKGIDIFIKALSSLNEHLKQENIDKTIVAFLWVPTGVKDIKPEIIENKTYLQDIEDSIQDMIDEIKNRMIYGLVADKEMSKEFIFGESMLKQMDKKLARLWKTGNPPVTTHNLVNENDEIYKFILKNDLTNKKDDKVKVIYYPIYLTGADQLVDLNYYESIMASHLGVFPSYYEPWGYTPAETGALGVASVTTDLAGFGRYIQKFSEGKKNAGIYVLDRLNKSDDEVVAQLTQVFIEFVNSSKQDRIENKLKAKRLSSVADWSNLIENYFKAHNMAVEKNS